MSNIPGHLGKKIQKEALNCRCSDEHLVKSGSDKQFLFVYESKSYFMGSVFLRTFQIVELMSALSSNKSKSVTVRKLLRKIPSDSILVCSKSAIRTLNFDDIEMLKRKGNTLVADPLDGEWNSNLDLFDIVISADTTLCSKELTNNVHSVLLHQAPDWRLRILRSKQSMTILYFGNRARFPFKDSKQEVVKKIWTHNYSFQGWISPRWKMQIRSCGWHLTASLPVGATMARPITKIVTALMVGAIPIIGKWEAQALDLLGSNYPYQLSSLNPKLMENEIREFSKYGLLYDGSSPKLEDNSIEELYCPVAHLNLWLSLADTID